MLTGIKHWLLILTLSLIPVTQFWNDPAWAAPSIPTDVLAKGISNKEIAVNWVPVSQAQGYNIYRSKTEDGTYVKIGQTGGELEAYFVDGDQDPLTTGQQPLPSSTSYFYKITAYDSSGESVQSAIYQFNYTDPSGTEVNAILSRGTTYVPDQPKSVQVLGGNATVTVSWRANLEPNLKGYNLYRGSASGGPYIKVNSSLLPITDTSYTDNTVANYYDYYYRVKAVDDLGKESSYSTEKWVKPEAPPVMNVPHIKYAQNTAECGTCHSTHTAVGAQLINAVGESTLCYTCHDGTGSQNITYQEFNGPNASRHPVPEGIINCSDCHNPHLDYKNPANPKLMQVDYNGIKNKGNDLCYKCHGVSSTLIGGNYETPFNNGIHSTNMPDPSSGTQIKCINCHLPHASPNGNLQVYKEENACFTCHSPESASSSAPDIYARFNANPDSDTRHDVFDEDQARNGSKVECVNCHNPHGVTAANKTVNPDNPAPDQLWTGTAQPSASKPLTGTINEFCIKCHDGAFPTAAQTSPYATAVSSGQESLINIKEKFYLGTDGLADKHGETEGQPKNLDTTMGYSNSSTAPNYVLACSKCHEPHGTLNGYNLRSEITSVDGTETKRGLLVYSWKYLNDGQVTQGTDARFFCNSCHGRQHMGNNKPFPTDCSQCHGHGKQF